MDYCRGRVDSLVSLCITYVMKNLGIYVNNLDMISPLPQSIKDTMLGKFTAVPLYRCNVNFNKALQALLHPMTQHINLSSATIDDEVLEIIQKSRNLRNVYLTTNINLHITNKALLNFVYSSKHLYLLRVSNCSAVNDNVLICLSKHCPELAGLDVGGCTKVTDFGLFALSTMKNLQWLTFSSTQVGNHGIEKLVSSCNGENIKELRLANCKNLSSEIFDVILQYCRNIEVLELYNLKANQIGQQIPFPRQQRSLKKLKQLMWTELW